MLNLNIHIKILSPFNLQATENKVCAYDLIVSKRKTIKNTENSIYNLI